VLLELLDVPLEELDLLSLSSGSPPVVIGHTLWNAWALRHWP